MFAMYIIIINRRHVVELYFILSFCGQFQTVFKIIFFLKRNQIVKTFYKHTNRLMDINHISWKHIEAFGMYLIKPTNIFPQNYSVGSIG